MAKLFSNYKHYASFYITYQNKTANEYKDVKCMKLCTVLAG